MDGMKKLMCLACLVTVLAAGCVTVEPASQVPPTDTPIVTVSPAALPSATDSPTPAPPTATATTQPVAGTLTIRVNVRSGPGTTYDSLGLLEAGEKVQIMARDLSGAWYQIVYPHAADGLGWVAAQYVQVAAGTEIPAQATPTPAGPTGRVLQRLNVRSGPGTGFETLGMLDANATVSLTGKNATASWFQIAYPSGPGGRGWVTAQYIQADASGLPVLDDFGTPVPGEGSGPTPVPVTPTPTVGPAFSDDDSAAAPSVNVTFSASGTRQFTYSSQVSAPQGDPADWIAFNPYAVNGAQARLDFSLTCSGNTALSVEIQQGGTPLTGWGALACGDRDKLILLPAGQTYTLRLAPLPVEGLGLVSYTLTVVNQP
jgi:uncharacterized protein YraI